MRHLISTVAMLDSLLLSEEVPMLRELVELKPPLAVFADTPNSVLKEVFNEFVEE